MQLYFDEISFFYQVLYHILGLKPDKRIVDSTALSNTRSKLSAA
jgi:hypothetical protein